MSGQGQWYRDARHLFIRRYREESVRNELAFRSSPSSQCCCRRVPLQKTVPTFETLHPTYLDMFSFAARATAAVVSSIQSAQADIVSVKIYIDGN